MKLIIGKLRGLQQCASSRGTFTCLALDHRQNLKHSLNPINSDSVSPKILSEFKLEIITALGRDAPALILDPEYSAAQAVAAGVIPGNGGLVEALEATGYTGDSTARHSRILPGWSVEKAKRMGACVVKLLVYYHPNSSAASDVESFVRQVADDCKNHDLALMLEPLSYALEENSRIISEEKRYIIVKSAERLTPLGVDILKAEFPLDKMERDQSAWKEACEEISSASVVPWILLSAAVDYETFVKQVTFACNAGASGIAVGRAIWKEAVQLSGEGRASFLHKVAKERLSRLTSLCNALGKSLNDAYQAEAPFDWYARY